MRFIDEYRDAKAAHKIAGSIRRTATRSWKIMEICGGQTHSIIKFGLDELLPDCITLIHGPGCPVCVTPLEAIEQAVIIASKQNVILCSFGDMLRVPGKKKDLLSVKAEAGDVRIVYSPMDALELAKKHPDKKVVFFAVGFETTAPANAMVVYQADKQGVDNFSVLVSHVLVPPAMEAVLSSKQNQVQGFLAAGHVCTVMGYKQYESIAEKYRVPIVVTGFEPVDILRGIQLCVEQLEKGSFLVQNEYSRVVTRDGNLNAQKIVDQVFCVVPRKWRGIGEIPNSGLGLQKAYERFDAEIIFKLENINVQEPPECIAGLILQGIKKPHECSEFDKRCKPEHPLGAPMVSSEGACNAYFRYRKYSLG
ncbi:MAG: hydrogenase formation protein HypD, partial [Candidatus Omnitrophica bacterium]|nr:hydrogenase formation protein HypD [Candidatus Omnitrophota bacterium]